MTVRQFEFDVRSWRNNNSRGCPKLFAVVTLMVARDTAVAYYFCYCDGAAAAATELMLRAARIPPRGAAASLLEVLLAAPRGGT